MNDQTGPDKKAPIKSPLAAVEKRFIEYLTPKFPAWIETWHLTLLTILWTAGVVGFSCLAGRTSNLNWLWLSSLMIFLQWFTDCFDGAVGRHKQTGLIKWGFFMDHFLDFVFMCSVFIGWSYLFEGVYSKLFWYMSLAMGCLMVNAFLGYGASGRFQIAYLGTGPTELRLYFILINAAVAFFGTAWLQASVPYLFAAFCLGTGVVVYRTQRSLWQMDMEIKNSQTKSLAKEGD